MTGLCRLRLCSSSSTAPSAQRVGSTSSTPALRSPSLPVNLHGITTEIARARGIQPADALGQIAGLLDEITECAIPLVIYNAPFDWPLLIAEARRHGVAMPRVPIIDPLVCDRAMDRYRRGSRKLEDVARHYDYALEHAHYAKADAVAAVAIARTVASRYADVGGHTPVQLQPLQAEWYAEWPAPSASIGASESTRDGRSLRPLCIWDNARQGHLTHSCGQAGNTAGSG